MNKKYKKYLAKNNPCLNGRKLKDMFNPKLRKYMEENEDVTIMGMMWSMYWRWFIVIMGVVFLAEIIAS